MQWCRPPRHPPKGRATVLASFAAGARRAAAHYEVHAPLVDLTQVQPQVSICRRARVERALEEAQVMEKQSARSLIESPFTR